jgi:cell wall-associated NlpC family hydrolase
MTPELLRLALSYASLAAPAESCGLVVVAQGAHVGDYMPVRNLSTAHDRFTIAPEDWARAEDHGRVAAVVHSHPGQEPTVPSEADRVACDLSGIPWLITGEAGSWTVLHPQGRPFEGREFCWGLDDCYALVRDWFSASFGWALPDFEREPDFWRERDLFSTNLQLAGFRPVEGRTPEPGDGLLFNVRGRCPDHCAVYLGNGRMLHQPQGRLSAVEPIGRYAEKLAYIARRAA